MNVRRILGWLLIVFAGLLVYSQTVALFHFRDFHVEGFDFPQHYAIKSSIQNYSFALVVALVGVFVWRSSVRSVAWAALVVSLFALWSMVGQELWLHYYELPHKYPHFAEVHPPYFAGKLWMFTPRFLWHLLLPVMTVFSAIYVFESARKSDA